MQKFYRDTFRNSEDNTENKAIRLSSCLKLIENSEYKDELTGLLNFNLISNEYLAISGIQHIVTSVIARDEVFVKKDIDCQISDVSFQPASEENMINIHFENIENYKKTSLTAHAIYNTKRDYFDWFYKLDKFANFCISEKHIQLLIDNISRLNDNYKSKGDLKKSFRLLLDRDGEYYVRAITSTNKYYDYNIRFSLFVTIIALFKLNKENGINFKLIYCEYDESFIRIYFEKIGSTVIPNVGKLNFILEMSNDEIKREAFRFSSLISLSNNSRTEKFEVELKPRKIRTDIISIRHDFLPSTIIGYIARLSSYIHDAEKDMINDITELSKVSNPDHLRYTLLRNFERSHNQALEPFKQKINNILNVRIKRVSELLLLMDKVDKIITDLELKEYIRYIYYDIIKPKK
ncbi:MAG: hypothetical protein A2X19_00495 [Bacteroidetes bacterium GWE2_39_28]|nr:MAG: hypothetical protein A2X19_00495 [Bacteroidetes bacterium GWE2_39_28]OFY14537.1 MAG: hypothetical protein A2X16_09495 [Bacteroidetes bacterium GWF2_39_10]OFZ08889.1 MAG: hypothetical protein A2322_00665 [Bacteroidetes bacterium RIFOXYB2_FULL_39_7]OFZ10425.1 MAG: hypothetical protein A2465_07235 [Bacteroidetes bacterium RIFOXYC2_FULL_39_11]HCT93310.1 hypothetical protein [Rikenellaceae bacterium]